MQRDILRLLHSEYAMQRERNAREEARRLSHAGALCPEISRLAAERHALLLSGVRGAFAPGAGVPGDLEARMRAYNERIAALLAQNGLPADYLAPVYRCAACRDTGYVGEPVREMCECLKNACYARMFAQTGLGGGAQTFEGSDERVYPDEPLPGTDVTQREYMRVLRARVEGYADSFPNTRVLNLLFTGGSGLGKTYFLRALAARVHARGHGVLCLSAYRLMENIKEAYFARESGGLRPFLEAELLLIDDLGVEPMLENITVEQLFNLLNERESNRLHTVISTNLSLIELKARYTERVTSRLMDARVCEVLTFRGRDVRLRREKDA